MVKNCFELYRVFVFKNSISQKFSYIRARVKRHLGKIGVAITIIYEGLLAKYLYDLYNVFSNLTVQSQVSRRKLPVYPIYAELFPWPKLIKYPIPTKDLVITFSRPMSGIEYAVKFFYDNPVLRGLAIAVPFIILGVYYGMRRWKKSKILQKINSSYSDMQH